MCLYQAIYDAYRGRAPGDAGSADSGEAARPLPSSMRARDLGIRIGLGTPGPLNAISDVEGVTVGHVTLIRGAGRLEVGKGPVRTGVTVVCPRGPATVRDPVFAGAHSLNGNGELTGLEWVRESGLLTTPVAITNTHSVGVVRDALVAASVDERRAPWSLPVVGETYDGVLNDINGFHVTGAHLQEALGSSHDGPVDEGAVGGGTGMICHEFKGGIGTASRVLDAASGGYTVGVLVQANHGKRDWLRIDGVRVGEAIPVTEVPSPYDERESHVHARVRFDHRRRRDRRAAPAAPVRAPGTARRASASPAPAGPAATRAATCSSPSRPATGMPAGHSEDDDPEVHDTYQVSVVGDAVIDPLFDAVIESTEEAIVNALVAATTVVGRDGITAHAIPHDRLVEVMRAAGR